MDSDSTVILLTPPGVGAIAVMRLSGAGVGKFLEAHFSKPVAPGRCVHGVLADGDEVIDDPVVSRGPGTTVDVNLHGGPWVVRSALALAERAGFRVDVGSPGLLAAAAVDADSLLEEDMLRSLPTARTELAVSVLLSQPAAWRGVQERVASSPGETQLTRDLMAEILADDGLANLLAVPRVAIVGVPNAGKSTLANALFAQERSITADLPGTTRDWVGEVANIDGLAVLLTDTPGFRPTDDPIEATAIARASLEVERADLVVLVLDPTQPLRVEQEALLARFPAALRVVNKADAAPVWQVTGFAAHRTAAATGGGIDDLRRLIRSRFGVDRRPVDAPRWWTQAQRQALAEATHRPVEFARWLERQLGTGFGVNFVDNGGRPLCGVSPAFFSQSRHVATPYLRRMKTTQSSS